MSNSCTRCGNDRIMSKTWAETVKIYGRSNTVQHTEFVCTNPECQKIVEELLRIQKEKREAITAPHPK